MSTRLPRLIAGALLGFAVVPAVGGTPAWAAGSCASPAATALARYADTTVPRQLAHDRVPGAVLSVVSGDRTVLARGYGLADVARGTPMDPARSLVRIASITKLFTWTAVMQQVEAGRLDLDADVNRYLTDFRVPATYPQPVTLRTLMNHTSGFEDRAIGTGARTAADVPPLGRYLAANLPARIRPPGEISAYSNYGAALAGHVLASVTGEPYSQYVQQHLLGPLGMAHSTATEPVPAALAPDLARSYDSDTQPPQPIPFTFGPLTPDGAISATATDMARFMTAHLTGGRIGDQRILSAATTARMHARTFSVDPRLGGYAHGFMDRRINGRQVLLHDGSWEGFQSALVLVPGCKLGLFVSTNGTTGVDTISTVIDGFLDRFAPASATPEASASVAGRTAAGTPEAGFYMPTRHNASTVEKLTALLGPLRLTVGDRGTVHFKGGTWTPRGGGLYQRDDGRDHLVFLTGGSGARYVATDGPAYELMTAGDSPIINLVVVLAAVLSGLGALAVPVAAGWRRIRRRPSATQARWRAARAMASGAALLGLAFLLGVVVTVATSMDEFLYGVPGAFRALLVVPPAVLAIGGAALACTVTGWRSSGASVAARVHQVTLLATLSALAWFLWQWNLLGWQLW